MSLKEYQEKHRDVERAVEDGLLEFSLHGRRLKGIFSLVRTNMDGKEDRNWLLMKKDDAYAVHDHYDAAER